MSEKDEDEVNPEVARELRNDFAFFVSMSLLRNLAMQMEDPKGFMKELIWKWREGQINTVAVAAKELEKKASSDELFNAIFGEYLKKAKIAQREVLVTSVRGFCSMLEKALIGSIENDGKPKEGEEF